MSLINEGLVLKSLHEQCHGNAETMAEALRLRMDADWCKAKGKPLLKPEDWSIKELYDFCEAVDVTQFPVLTATLIEKKVMAGYEDAKMILDQLVTPFNSSLQISKIPGAYSEGTLHDIEPGDPYQHDGDVTEKYVQIEGKKRGSILDVTMEAIKFDQTGLILMRADKFGRHASIDREKRGLYTILDITTGGVNYYAWYPSGTRTALYAGATAGGAHAQSNLIAHALQNWTDIDAGYSQLGLMQDDNGDPIFNTAKILLVPLGKETTAKRLISNTLMPASRSTGDSALEANPWANRFTVLSSPLLDAISATQWYMGDFKKQFVEKIVMPLEVLTRKDNKNDPAWERDIVAQYKIRHYTQVGALDYRHVIKSLGTYGVCPEHSYCSSWDEAVVA